MNVRVDENINMYIYISAFRYVDIYCFLNITNKKLPHPSSVFTATDRLLGHRAKVVVTVDVVAPPRGEWYRRTSSTEDGKGQDKENRETSTVKGASDQVRVILEDAWAIVAEVELDEESGKNLAEDDASLRRIIRDITGVLDKLGEVEIRKRKASNPGDKLRAPRVSTERRRSRILER